MQIWRSKKNIPVKKPLKDLTFQELADIAHKDILKNNNSKVRVEYWMNAAILWRNSQKR